jgi:hypothetical protein
VTVLTLYGKPGCHLCDEARPVVAAVARERGLELRELDVSIDPGLNARYGERIPVVEAGGEPLAELVVDPDALRSALDRVVP